MKCVICKNEDGKQALEDYAPEFYTYYYQCAPCVHMSRLERLRFQEDKSVLREKSSRTAQAVDAAWEKFK